MSSIDDLILETKKEWGEDTLYEGVEVMDCEKIPFTSPMLNYMLHGGFPRGRVVEFYGLQGSGKTTTSIDACASAQKYFKEHNLNLRIVYIDIEETLDSVWAEALGLDLDSLILMQPKDHTAEEILKKAIDFLKTGEVGLMVIDSIPSLNGEVEKGKEYNELTRGGNAKLIKRFLKDAVPLLSKYNATLIAINQFIHTMSSYGSPYTTTGGTSMGYVPSVKLQFKKGEIFDNKGNKISSENPHAYGNIVEVKIDKVKSCKPDRLMGYYTINYYEGIDYISDLITLCLEKELIIQKGAFFSFIDDNGEVIDKVQGKPKIKPYLLEHKEVLELYNKKIQEIIK